MYKLSLLDVHSLEVSLQASKEKTQMLQSERDNFQSQLQTKEEEYAKLDDDHCNLKKKMLSLEFDYKQQQQMLEALHKRGTCTFTRCLCITV